MQKKSLTIDTSCVISLLQLPEDSTPKGELEALHQIQKWSIEKRIVIAISEKSRTESILNQEKAKQLSPMRSSRLLKWLNTLEILNNFETVISRWIGTSRLGIDTVLCSKNEKSDFDKLSLLLFEKYPENMKEGDVFDLAILFEHYIHGNDFFVTRDIKNNMVKKKAELRSNWNIIVCNPIEVVNILRKTIKN